jgi:hypothetical protein
MMSENDMATLTAPTNRPRSGRCRGRTAAPEAWQARTSPAKASNGSAFLWSEQNSILAGPPAIAKGGGEYAAAKAGLLKIKAKLTKRAAQ